MQERHRISGTHTEWPPKYIHTCVKILMYRRHISVGWYNLCSDNKKYNLYINVPEIIGRSCLVVLK